MGLAKRCLMSVAVAISMIASTVAYSSNALCPRGEYTFTKGEGGLNEITAKVTLPTPGYKVSLAVGPELVFPPRVYFKCEKPSGNVIQVMTAYTATLRVHYDRVSVRDAQGGQSLVAGSAAPATTAASDAKACSANSECNQGEFCDTTPKCPGSDARGVCMPKPQLCTMEFNPVKGCDGKTYTNRCAAAAEGQSIQGMAKIK